ncbi:AB hydrolase superfamily protein YdjP [Podospora australis]|uniref:AB hydrolase superfamily protein YdjP n=1 Tax=Podospora australis TaxID=1536484 RepID=A0AAN6WMG6_9PEZI|nr:AB hydrolase superfamily protein YdjP [Podospora australis]
MKYSSFIANDGTVLAFQSSIDTNSIPNDQSGSQDSLILLLHGFSGSSEYFIRNVDALISSGLNWAVAPDMRGHGRSGHSRGGYHVARLAADLRELLAHLRATGLAARDTRIVPVGCSIGAAIVWTYIELFGDADFAGFIFVDQAPLQDRSRFDGWDESKAHRGCYDEHSMLAAQEAWISSPAETHKGLVKECLGYRYKRLEADAVTDEQARADEEFFTTISARCDGTWLARLLADHTRYDHREACELITKPTLVMAGERSGCFSLQGMGETVDRVNSAGHGKGSATMSIFPCGHWLFYEEPERFNTEVLSFVRSLRGG